MAKQYENKTKEELLKIIDELENKKQYGLVWDEERIPEQVVIEILPCSFLFILHPVFLSIGSP
ncbi:MAG: hypothetical protein AAB071_05440 [Bacteroidota bacterium]